MPCETNTCKNSCIYESLCENLNSQITVYTNSGCCFTGLLVGVSCDALKLVTNTCVRGCNRASRITICPIDEISAVTFCDT